MNRPLALAVVLLGACAPPTEPPAVHSPSPSATVDDRPRPPAATRAPIAEPPPPASIDEAQKRPEARVADIIIGGRPEQDPRGTQADPSDEGRVDLNPEVWDASAYVRPLRRLNVDQLRQSIDLVTGGRRWVRQGQDRLYELRATLGVPDWLLRVTEDRRPSPTFAKFLRDAAIEVCVPFVADEMNPNVVAPEDRVFVVHADPNLAPADDQATRDNLVYLLLRFHGARVAPDSAEVDRWVQLVTEVVADTGDNRQAWQATCVALMLHPRFYGY